MTRFCGCWNTAAKRLIGPLKPKTVLRARRKSSQTTNCVTAAFGSAVSYDNAGNVTSHPYIANGTYYTGGLPNQFSSATFSPFNPFRYAYDGESRRVRKAVDLPGARDEVTAYVYDAFGKLAAEYSNQAMAQEVGIWFRTTDHLGSTRIVSDAGQIVTLLARLFPLWRADLG